MYYARKMERKENNEKIEKVYKKKLNEMERKKYKEKDKIKHWKSKNVDNRKRMKRLFKINSIHWRKDKNLF